MCAVPLNEEDEMQAKHVKSQEIFNQIGSRHIASNTYMRTHAPYSDCAFNPKPATRSDTIQ